MQRPIEEYVKYSDRLAQDVVNTWGTFTTAGQGAALTAEFNQVFETTCEFHQAKKIADNWRGAGIPNGTVDAIVETKRLAFAHAYKVFYERHES
jgi:hypothetical protein